jgi:molecular chaperone GrpE
LKKHKISEEQIASREDESVLKKEETAEKAPVAEREQLLAELQEINAKYLRLYAEFENYKKRVSKDKEELIKYGNESLLYEILPFIDHLEMALKHASNEVSSGLVQGVEITLRDLRKTLEKFGLTAIEAYGKPFDPVVHHAMSQVERNDTEDNTVVEEFRRGYMLRDKVLRPALVAVSKKTVKSGEQEETEINKNIEEEY